MATAAAIKVRGIFNPGERLEKKAAEKEGRKAERKASNSEKQYQELRAKIIKQTLDMTEKELLEYKEDMDAIESMSATEKFIQLKNNADQAERVRKTRGRNIFITALSSAFTVISIAKLLNPTVAALGTIIHVSSTVVSLFGTYYGLKGLWKSGRGNKSDELLKRQDQKEGFDELFDMYEDLSTVIEKDKDMLMEKKKTLSKKEFKEFMTNYIATKKEELQKPDAERPEGGADDHDEQIS